MERRDWEEYWNTFSKCTICGENRILQCKCPRSDSECKNNHQWHHCTTHMIRVESKSDHGKGGCSCDHNKYI
jgi:hypothetical protein